MAFTSILHKSASSLTTLASQLARGHGNYHCALFTAITHSSLSPLVPNLHYSDETLLPIIQSEIQCLQETDGHDWVSLFFGGGGGGGVMGCLVAEKVWENEKKVEFIWNFFCSFLGRR